MLRNVGVSEAHLWSDCVACANAAVPAEEATQVKATAVQRDAVFLVSPPTQPSLESQRVVEGTAVSRQVLRGSRLHFTDLQTAPFRGAVITFAAWEKVCT